MYVIVKFLKPNTPMFGLQIYEDLIIWEIIIDIA